MILGGLDDQISLLIWAKISTFPFGINTLDLISNSIYFEVFQSYLRPWTSDQPLLWIFVSLFASLFRENFYNLFLIASTGAIFTGCYFVFRKFPYWYFYTFIFTFSTNMWIHLGKHPALMMLWIFPIAVYLIERTTEEKYNPKSLIKASVFIGVSILISQYYGYFLLIFFTLWMLIDLFYKKNNLKVFGRNYFIFVTSVILTTIVFLFPYIKENYFDPKLPDKYTSSRQLQRPFDDFVTFSARPWYFVVPSPKSPVYKDFSQSLISKIKETNYFLADDYFQGEHDGNFFGYVFYLTVGTTFLLFIIYTKNTPQSENKYKAYKYLILFLCLFILSMPPFITLAGYKLYFPSYLLYKFFPMFRTLVRLSILEQLSLLMMFGYMLIELKDLKLKFYSTLKNILPILTLLILVETYVSVKVYTVNPTPAVYTYMGDSLSKTKFLVYPYSKTQEALFYLPNHKQELINVRHYASRVYSAEELTKNLSTPDGFSEALKLTPDYLIVFKEVSEEEILFFLTNSSLKLEKEFEDSYIFTFKSI